MNLEDPPLSLPTIKSSKTVYQGFFDVKVNVFEPNPGILLTYTILDLKTDAVAILARTKEGKFVINKEFRHPTGKWLLSCPGGRIDPGESALEAGKRELLEETGYGQGTFHLIGDVYPLPAVCNQRIFYLYAENVEFLHPCSHEPLELISTELKTEEELFNAIEKGYPLDAVLCTALLLARKHW